MSFDIFGDAKTRGYLQNVASLPKGTALSRLENTAFEGNLEKALDNLVSKAKLDHGDILKTHEILFKDVYPTWAGKDRNEVAPDLVISKAARTDLFALPRIIYPATEQALKHGQDLYFMRSKPGEVMGELAFAHPFLDGNGRTIITVHTELARRAGMTVEWEKTNKQQYIAALTKELLTPGKGHLDRYLEPYVRGKNRQDDPVARLAGLSSIKEGGQEQQVRAILENGRQRGMKRDTDIER
jgi:cell filamentation protein